MRALVTGVGGFVGGHLAAHLRASGFEVYGIHRSASAPVAGDGVERLVGDVSDRSFMTRTIRTVQPTHVFHLAWTFGTSASLGRVAPDPDLEAVSVLFDALRQAAPDAWALLASSSAVYGAPEVQPIDEDAPLRPTTAYGRSKVATEELAAEYVRNHGSRIVVARTFNLIGPGVPGRLLPGSLAAQIVVAENGGQRTVRVGRLDSARDYLDVRDAVRAYVAMAAAPTDGSAVFNVCAGIARSCQELAEEFLGAARVPVELLHDTQRLQAGDVDCQRGLASRLERATGWSPEIPFSASVHAMLELERARTRRREALR